MASQSIHHYNCDNNHVETNASNTDGTGENKQNKLAAIEKRKPLHCTLLDPYFDSAESTHIMTDNGIISATWISVGILPNMVIFLPLYFHTLFPQNTQYISNSLYYLALLLYVQLYKEPPTCSKRNYFLPFLVLKLAIHSNHSCSLLAHTRGILMNSE